jgi:hypothetical protein
MSFLNRVIVNLFPPCSVFQCMISSDDARHTRKQCSSACQSEIKRTFTRARLTTNDARLVVIFDITVIANLRCLVVEV